MALSNKFGWLVLTTGNKSELAVGYSTLYGDTAGGFAVIKDVPKTLVYRLCEWRNSQSEVIPEAVLTKPPTAELRPGQLDTDSLPAYEQLDPVLEAYVEGDLTAGELVEAGFDPELVRTRRPSGRPGRVQAAPEPTGRKGDAEGFRAGPPDADHQRLSLTR